MIPKIPRLNAVHKISLLQDGGPKKQFESNDPVPVELMWGFSGFDRILKTRFHSSALVGCRDRTNISMNHELFTINSMAWWHWDSSSTTTYQRTAWWRLYSSLMTPCPPTAWSMKTWELLPLQLKSCLHPKCDETAKSDENHIKSIQYNRNNLATTWIQINRHYWF